MEVAPNYIEYVLVHTIIRSLFFLVEEVYIKDSPKIFSPHFYHYYFLFTRGYHISQTTF